MIENVEKEFGIFITILDHIAREFPLFHKKSLERPIASLTKKQFESFVKYDPDIFINNNTQIKFQDINNKITIFDIEFYTNIFEDMTFEEFKEWFDNNKMIKEELE